MTLTRALPLLLLTSWACAPAQAPFTEADADAVAEEVRAASLALVDALNTHEADSILSFYSLDEDFTYVACTTYYVGGEGYGAFARSFHALYPQTRYTMQVGSIRVLGPTHAAVALEGSLAGPLWVTRVLRKEAGGRWRVTWEHESWPGCSDPKTPHPGTEPGDSASAPPSGAPS
jgi:ketosteroid isomerase-like protein